MDESELIAARLRSELALQMVTAIRRALASLHPAFDQKYLEQMESLPLASLHEAEIGLLRKDATTPLPSSLESREIP